MPVVSCTARPAKILLQRLAVVVVASLLGGFLAAEAAGKAVAVHRAAYHATAVAPAGVPRFELRAVMGRGADVDGDGAPDFVSPTGLGLRGEDAFGSGAYLSSRDSHSRAHVGADFLDRPGQPIAAPISGYVTKIGYAYADDQALRYVELTNKAIGYIARVFYVQPSVVVGQAVRQGLPIGAALSLQGRYPGIADHVHVETTEIGIGHIDPAKLIPSPTLRLARRDMRRPAKG